MKENCYKTIILLAAVIIIVQQAVIQWLIGISAFSGSTKTPKGFDKSINTDLHHFEKHPMPAVIVTKVKTNANAVEQLMQSYCLLTAAYNERVNHDILVFSSLPIPKLNQDEIRIIVAPANVTFHLDAPPLSELLESFTLAQKEEVQRYCNVSSYHNLTWETQCRDPKVWYPYCPLAYLWQAEWRAKHLWHHPALKNYRYLMWWDSDNMATKIWDVDPIEIMARDNLTLLYERFIAKIPANELRDFDDRLFRSFGKYLCSVTTTVDGSTIVDIQNHYKECPVATKRSVFKVHGFFHIVDLNEYLSPKSLAWYDNLIGDSKFSRRWDDQIAVTMPGVMLHPERSFGMRGKGIDLDILHNKMLHGDEPAMYFRKFYAEKIKSQNSSLFSEKVHKKCEKYIKYDGRRR